MVVNAAVSDAPVTFVELEGAEPTWFIAHCGPNKLPKPMPLRNGHFLYLYNSLGLRREERYLATLEYRYVYQATDADASWIFRYEYLREPPTEYRYPRAHVHINASPASYTADKPFADLHLPTGRRVTIEQVVRHLVVEHGVEPASTTWEATLREAQSHFDEIQRRRVR